MVIHLLSTVKRLIDHSKKAKYEKLRPVELTDWVVTRTLRKLCLSMAISIKRTPDGVPIQGALHMEILVITYFAFVS